MTRYMPSNIDAEQQLLGVLLYDPSCLAAIEGRVRAIDFYVGGHQLAFAVISELAAEGLMTLAAVWERLKSYEAVTALGGQDYLSRMADRAPLSSQALALATTVADLSLRRQMIGLFDDARVEVERGESDSSAMISCVERRLNEVRLGAGFADHWEGGDALCDAVEDILAGRGRPGYVPTGIDIYDQIIGGLQDARMNILAARPRMGKSALAAIIALKLARLGLGVGGFSLEMDARELGLRTACAAAYRHGEADNPVYFEALKNTMPMMCRERLIAGAHELRKLPLYFDQRPGLRPAQIGPAARRLIRQWERDGIKPGCIIVDHIMIVHPDRESGNKVVDMSGVSGFFAGLARETGVPVLALAQLNRVVDGRGVIDKDPQLSDLGWSGALEQDAAQVTFIVRPSEYLRDPPDKASDFDMAEYFRLKEYWANRGKLINEKNRSGPSHVKMEIGLSVAHNAQWEVAQP